MKKKKMGLRFKMKYYQENKQNKNSKTNKDFHNKSLY